MTATSKDDPRLAPLPHPADPDAVLIPLTREMFAEVSRIDAEAVSAFSWHVSVYERGYYAMRNLRTDKGWTIQRMHTFIAERMGIVAPKVDHKNGDGLDNRRQNLRGATNSQNGANTGLFRSNKSGFKGVSWNKRYDRWRVVIKVNQKQIHVGHFRELADAAEASRAAQTKYFGEFAK